MFESAILVLLLALPQWSGDSHETAEQRRTLLTPVASAIASTVEHAVACEDCLSHQRARMLAVLLATQAWHETRLARYVLEGRCHDGPDGAQCDGGLARGPWQVHQWCRAAWDHEDGSLRSHEGGAYCALDLMVRGMRRCHSVEGAFAGMRGTAECSSPWAAERARSVRRFAPLLPRGGQ